MSIARSLVLACGCAAAVFVTASTAAGQEPAQLGALRTPPSPAFTVLGLEPSAVERPATPSDASVALINRFRDGTVPKNFAFEASPYWLVGRPNLTWKDDRTRNPGASIARTTSVSLATAETGEDDAPVTSLAFGFRTMLASGHLSAESQKALEGLEKALAEDSALLASFPDPFAKELSECIDAPPVDVPTCAAVHEQKRGAFLEALIEGDAYRKASKLRAMKDVSARREGFFLELAFASVWDFADAEWESQQFRQRSVWVTPSYEAGHWAAVGVLRYVDDGQPANEDAVDWGGRGVYSTSDYAMSLEFVERAPRQVTETLKRSHRLVGIAEYRLSSGTWLVASFGKDRQKTAATPGSLVAQLGVSFNFSKDRYTAK